MPRKFSRNLSPAKIKENKVYGLYKGFFHPPGYLYILIFASFICLLRSPQLGTLLKDLYDQQETLWIIRLPTFFLFYLPLSKYVHKVVYLPRSKIFPIVHISVFLNAAGPQNARNVLSENLILPTPPPLQETSAVFLARLLVGTQSRRKKSWLRAWLRVILYNNLLPPPTSLASDLSRRCISTRNEKHTEQLPATRATASSSGELNCSLCNWRFCYILQAGAHNPERANPILGLCHGGFSDRFIFRHILRQFFPRKWNLLHVHERIRSISYQRGKGNVIKRQKLSFLGL